MAKCQLSGCTVDATTRLTIKNPKKCTTAFIDLCDRHIRETTEKAKPDSYLLCSLEHIRKVRETKLQSA